MADVPLTRVPLYLNLSLVMSLLTLAVWVGGQAERLNNMDKALDRLNQQAADEATTVAAMSANARGADQLMHARDDEISARVRRIEDQLDQAARVAGRKR